MTQRPRPPKHRPQDKRWHFSGLLADAILRYENARQDHLKQPNPGTLAVFQGESVVLIGHLNGLITESGGYPAKLLPGDELNTDGMLVVIRKQLRKLERLRHLDVTPPVDVPQPQGQAFRSNAPLTRLGRDVAPLDFRQAVGSMSAMSPVAGAVRLMRKTRNREKA